MKSRHDVAPISETYSDSSALRSDRRTSSQNGARHGRRAGDPVLFHSGTEARSPLWYEQALQPVFVAQLLGQLEEDAEARLRSASVAYGEDSRKRLLSLLLDARA